MNIVTELETAMKYHCKAVKITDHIEQTIEQQLYSTKEFKPKIDLMEGYNSDGDYDMQTCITYPTVTTSDIETTYEIITSVKNMLEGMDCTVTYNQSVKGLEIKISIEGRVNIE